MKRFETRFYKPSGMTSLLLLGLALPVLTQAAPQGGVVQAGSGSVSSSLTTTTINQLSSQLVLDWQSFNIAADETVRFLQPSSAASVLNRIQDSSATQIFGKLTANGNVFLLNNNGFLFGETAQVQVGSLITSNLTMNTGEFMDGLYRLYPGDGSDGLIVNRGLIAASTGGVSIISDTGVVNEGRIIARYGSVNIAATTAATLDFDGDGLLQIQVGDEVIQNARSLDDAINNSGEIIAEGGEVLIQGNVSRDVFTNAINNSGLIKASGILDDGGVIRLVSANGDITNSGQLDASSAEGRGGKIHLLGERVALLKAAVLDADGETGGGEVLVGGDYQGANADIDNARQTYVDADARITANAGMSGDGGKVIVWADNTTQYYGDTEARGGMVSGDGGLVEVSGKNWLDFNGTVDTSAADGKVGTLLLDPTDVFIADSVANAQAHTGRGGAMTSSDTSADTGPSPYVPDDTLAIDGSLLLTTTIETALTNNDVVVNAAATGNGTGTGKVVVVDSIAPTGNLGVDRTLTLNGKDIYVDAAIDASGESGGNQALNVILNADNINGGGTVELNATINTNDGNLTVSSIGDVRVAAVQTIGAGTADFTSTGVGSDIYSVAATDQINADTIIVDSAGTIGANGALDTNIIANNGSLDLISVGDITVVEDSPMDLSDMTITDSGTNARTIDLTAASWDFDIDLDVGNDQITLKTTASGGEITGNGGRLTAASVTLRNLRDDAVDDIGTSGNHVLVGTSQLIIDTSGDFYVDNNVALTDFTMIVNTTNNDNTYQLTAPDQLFTITDENNTGVFLRVIDSDTAGPDTANLDFTVRNRAPAGSQDDISIRDGDIDVNAGIVTLITDNGKITKESSNAIITADSLQMLVAESIDVITSVNNIAAESTGTGNITVVNVLTGSIDVTSVTNGTLGLTTTGVTSADGDVVIAATNDIDVTETVNAGGSGLVVLSTTANAGNINGAGTITTANTATLTANGGIGGAVPVNLTAGVLSFSSSGNDAAGDITAVATGAKNISDVSLTTNGSGTQTIDLSADSWTIDADFTDAMNDALLLTATAGTITDTVVGDGGFSITADSLVLNATGLIDAAMNAAIIEANSGGSLHITNNYNAGALTIGGLSSVTGLTAAGDITLLSVDDGSIVLSEAVDAGAGNVVISTTDTGNNGVYTISGAGTITGANITLTADSSIDVNTVLGAGQLALTTNSGGAAGNITVVDAGDRTISDLAILTNGTGTQTLDLTANSWVIDTPLVQAGDDLLLTASGGTITDTVVGDGGNAITANTLVLDATGLIDVTVIASALEVNSGGSLYINNNNTAATLTLGGVSALNGLLANGDITLSSTDAGSIVIAEDVNAGSANVIISTTDTATNGVYTLTGNGVITGNNITLTADAAISANTALGAGALSMTTNSNDADGDITLVEAGDMNLTDVAITINGTGVQTIDLSANSWVVDADLNTTADDNLSLRATGGSIIDTVIGNGGFTLSANSVVLEATGLIDIALNAATIEASSGGILHITNNYNAGPLTIGGLSGIAGLTAAGDITLLSVDEGSIVLSEAVDAGTGSVLISTTDTAANGVYTISGPGNITGSDITLIADASIDANTVLGGGTLSLTTNSDDAAGSITIVDTGSSISFGNLSLTMNGGNVSGNRTIDLTARSWTVAGAFDVGLNNLNLTSSESNVANPHGIFNAGGVDSLTASGNITLTSATGIGTSVSPIRVTANTLAVNSTGVGSDGSIFVDGSGSALSLGSVSTALASSQTVALTADSWTLSADVDFGTDNLAINAIAGDVSNAGIYTLTANSIGMGASGDVIMITDASTIAASAGGQVAITSIYNAGDLTVGTVDNISGITAGTSVDLQSENATVVIDQAITATTDIKLCTVAAANCNTGAGGIAGTSDITGSALVSTAGNLLVKASGGIGTGAAINTDTATLNLITFGDNAAGDVSVIFAGNQTTSAVPFPTINGIGTQTIDLQAESWLVDGNLNLGADNLILRASGGPSGSGISSGGGTLVANELQLFAQNNANDANIGTNLNPVSTDITAAVDAFSAVADNGVYITNVGAMAVKAAGIDAGTGSLGLTLGGSLISNGTLAGDNLVINASGAVNTATQVNTLAITTSAAGAISITNTGALDITGTGISNFDGAISITADDTITVSADIVENNSDAIVAILPDNVVLTTTANQGDIEGNGGTIITGATITLDADGGIGLLSPVNTQAGALILTTADALAGGNIRVVNTLALNTSAVALNTSGTAQTVDLSANSWTVNSTLGNTTDNLILQASSGSIDNVGGVLTADQLGLRATSNILGNTDAATVAMEVSGMGVISVTNAGALVIGTVTDNAAVDITGISNANGPTALTAGGTVTIDQDITSISSDVNITTTAGDIEGSAASVSTTGIVTLSAIGGIGKLNAINTSGVQALALTSSGSGSNGDITVINNGGLATSRLAVSTNASAGVPGLQTVSVTADDWQNNTTLNLNGDNFNMISSVGNITNPGGVGSITGGNDVSLQSAGGIGASGASINVTANGLQLTTAGLNNAGDIFIQSGSSIDLNSGITTDSGTTQNIVLEAAAWNLSSDQSIADDALVLTATAGAINGGGNTITATSVGLKATGSVTNIFTDAATIAARSDTGNIAIASLYNTGDLTVGDLTVVTGLSTGAGGAISLSSQDAAIVVDSAVNAGTGSVSLTTTENSISGEYDISGSGLITAGATLTVDADGSIAGLSTDLLGTGTLNLATATQSGAANNGDISITEAGAMSTSRVTAVSTDGASTQNIALTAANWTIDALLDVNNDNLTLTASSGDIQSAGGSLTANDLSLVAQSLGASIGSGLTPTSPISVALSGQLSADAGNGAGSIFITETTGSMSIGAAGIDAGSGDVELIASTNLISAGTITGNNLLLVAGGNVASNTDITNLSVTAGGNVAVSNVGGLSIISQMQSDAATVHSGINAAGSVTLNAGGIINQDVMTNVIATALTTVSSGGLTLDSTTNSIGSIDATDNTGGNIVVVDSGSLDVAGIATTGDITLTTTGAITNSGAVSGNLLTTSSVGGVTLDDNANDVSQLVATNTGGGDITFTDTGDLRLGQLAGEGNITVNTTGDITQIDNIGTPTGDITVATSGGSLTMDAKTVTVTNGGTIDYTANGGDMMLNRLDAAAAGNGPATIGVINLTSTGKLYSTNPVVPSVRADVVDVSTTQLGFDPSREFIYSGDIATSLTLLYATGGFTSSIPFNANVNVIDLGTGLIDSSAARSAGNQRGQSSGLEDVGFIDAALFSDINLFVVDGMGIALPDDQNDIPPGQFRNAPGPEDDEEEERLNVGYNLQ